MTVASMTGFARVTGEHGAWQWAWEVKSVNARSLDVRLRTPPGHDRLEMAAREAVGKRFKRGAFNLNLAAQRDESGQDDRPTQINRALLDQLVEEAQRYGGRVAPDPPRIETLLAIRGVVEAMEPLEDEESVAARMDAMRTSLEAALDALRETRAQEGAHLERVLAERLDELESLRRDASDTESARPEKRMAQLREQVSELLDTTPALPEERLAQEVALLVTKGDIREELDRLDAHVASARELLGQGGAVGRRLDFLCQEMTREANTICSKSNDVDLTRVGLAMKATVEQFREQVQNVE
ncbi:MAG: YicC family protein [Alphaproteobacteria bacterium]|nr:YicC family protein [Alphaproteobacteria bacterium]